MQKVIAVFLASLLLFPATSFSQDSTVNDGKEIGQGSVATAPVGTLRESAIRQAQLAAATTVQAPQSTSWRSRHPIASGTLWGAGVGAAVGAAYGAYAFCNPTYDCGSSMGETALVGAAVGAMWGSVIGLIVKFSRRD